MKLANILAVLAAGLIASGCTKPETITQWPFDAREAAHQQDVTAKALGVSKEIALDLGNNVKMKAVLIPAGMFKMGSPDSEKGRGEDEGPLHNVVISKAFYMGVSNVTRAQFAAFVRDTSYATCVEMGLADVIAWDGFTLQHVQGVTWKKPGFDQTDDHPVVCVSQEDALAFCGWLSKKIGKAVKLPTEAQWEYAARAGTSTPYPWGDNPDDGKGWCNGNDQTAKKKFSPEGQYFTWDDGYLFTSPVGKFRPNAFGLDDMHGNAATWCEDVYDAKYYARSPKIDPRWPSDEELSHMSTLQRIEAAGADSKYVVRGGCWGHYPVHCRTAYRLGLTPYLSYNYVGFRVIVEMK